MSEGTPPPPPPSDNPYGGAPPPPPGGQPPTSPGPPGGYGTAPPPPPAPPLGGGAYSPTDAISYGWAKFKAKPGDLLLPVLVVLLIVVVLQVLVQLLLRATLLSTHDCTRTILGTTVEAQCGPGFFASLIGFGVAGLVVSLVAQALGAGLIKIALNIADGKPASMGEIGRYATNPRVLVAALIVAAATFIGTILCYVPGLIVGFLLNWTMFYVVDKDMAPVDAVKASVKFVTDHLGDTILFYLLGLVVLIVGAVLCLVGLLVAAPVVLVGAAFTFRKLSGEQVSPAPV